MRRLSEHELVAFSGPFSEGSLCFAVLAMFRSVAALHPLDLERTQRLPPEMEDAYLSFQHEGQLVGLRGTMYRSGDDVRFRVADAGSLARRASTRVDLMVPVSVRRRDGSTLEGITVDVALEGVLVETSEPLEVGETVLLSLQFSVREAPVEATSTVVRTVENRSGMSFESISKEDRRFLTRQICERSAATYLVKTTKDLDRDDVLF